MIEIYLDNAATTRPWPEVREAVADCLGDGFANASSLHRRGLSGARRIEEAAVSIRKLVGSTQWNVVFTSGGTEADTTAILGICQRGRRKGIVRTSVEHAAVEDACAKAAQQGRTVTVVSAGPGGQVDPRAVAKVVNDETLLVTVTHVANEMGTVQPVNEIARQVKRAAPRAVVHVDGVQGTAQLARLDYAPEIDMVSISAHKIHGPQGVGALLLRPHVRVNSLLCGGDQQGGIRPGTLNLPGIAGFGVAAELFFDRRAEGVPQMKALGDLFLSSIASGSVRCLGKPDARAPGLLVVAVEGVKSQVLLHTLEARGVLASAGSACHASRREPPRCLLDAGLRNTEGVVRFSLSVDTTEADVCQAAKVFAEAVQAVRTNRAGEL